VSGLRFCAIWKNGTAADTDVTDGIYLASTNGTLNGGLRGGGFETSYVDSNADGYSTAANVTSKHTVGTVTVKAWGSDTNGTTDEAVGLQCGNCHNPHGNGQYRMLRPKPTSLSGYASLTAVNVPNISSDNFTVDHEQTSPYYRDLSVYTSGITGVIADWCGQCHTMYRAGAGSETAVTASGAGTPSGWETGIGQYKYRHRTQGVTGECFACHVAHGTSANMSGNAVGLTWPDSTASGALGTQDSMENAEDSRLLILDERGVCMQCHTSSALTGD